MDHFERDLNMARQIARLAAEQGGRAYFVGGFVRDGLQQRENKDIDMEIHGLTPRQAEALLDSLGERITIGESFGIYALRGYHIDIALPRRETLRGTGHRDFDVCVDPQIGTEKAAKRRDFTVNAMLQDILTGEIIDHFGGRADLERGILRHVSGETFGEDPLRVLRGAQFAARFGLRPAEETVELCKSLTLRHLPRERIMEELKKALLKAERPSVFFEVLRQMEQLSEWFPELEALIGVPQPTRHHGEGDVWNHTMMVLDEAAKLRQRAENPLGLMLAALTHDFGKAVCTQVQGDEIHAYGHEAEGLPLIEAFLNRLTGEHRLREYVCNLAEYHMKPFAMAAAGASVKATNKLFDQSADPVALICLAMADNRGKISDHPYVPREEFLFERLGVYRETMAQPFVMGRDLIEAGLQPDVRFSDLLALAHKLRLAGIPKEQALKQVLAEARKK